MNVVPRLSLSQGIMRNTSLWDSRFELFLSAIQIGRLGYDLYRKARGIHNSPVKSNRIRKSIGKEKTYGKILRAEEDIKKELTLLSEKVALNLHQQEKAGKIVILKIRYEDFSTLTKRKSLAQKTQDASQISQIALQLYEELSEKERGVRLLGITLTGFFHVILLHL
ncbi:DNA polymerase IV [Streptococcus pneumoniae]|nr:DNA polymerase IV [Streptococcus pneumoniae]